MIIISAREFRQNQEMYLNKIKNGEDIVLKSRKYGSFKLVPVTDNDKLIDKNSSPLDKSNLIND